MVEMRKKPTEKTGGRKTLIVRLTAIGDVVLTIPVVYSVCRAYPHDRFIFVTRRALAPMMVNTPDNLTVIGEDFNEEYKGLRGMSRLFSKLWNQERFDTLVDLQNSRLTRVLQWSARLRGVKVSAVSHQRGDIRKLVRRHNKILLPLKPAGQRYFEAFARAGFPAEDTFVGMFDSPADTSDLSSSIPEKHPGDKWIGIAPFAKYKSKIYPPALMKKVVDDLSALPSVTILLFGGGEEERQILTQWQQQSSGNVISLAEQRLGFGRELALLSNIDCMVSMDSANMHLASMTGTPVVSVWGATHPYCGYKSRQQSDDNIIQVPMPCRPCSTTGEKPCHQGDYFCLNAIKPAVIIEKVKTILFNEKSIT